MDHRQAVQGRFSESADLYAKSGVHADSEDLRRMTQAAKLDGNEIVLDVGTGTAHTALAFAPHVATVIGLDLTQAMLDAGSALAKERGIDNVELRQGEAEALPFDDHSFDIVVARQCPHHFEDVGQAVKEAARVLRPGGKLLILDSVSLPHPKLDTFMNAVEMLRDPSHVRNYALSEWHHFYEDARIEVTNQTQWLLRIHFEDWIQRGGTAELAIAQLKAMLGGAPSEIRNAYEIDPQRFDFGLPVGMTEGRKGAA